MNNERRKVLMEDAMVFASVEEANRYYECQDVVACIDEGCEGLAVVTNTDRVVVFTDVSLEQSAADLEETYNMGFHYRSMLTQNHLKSVALSMYF
jgi:hypothetical protein